MTVHYDLYCTNSLGPNFGVFESLHKEKHINSTRKRVQSATQRIFHRKPAQFFENSTKLCVKSRHFETELNMSLTHWSTLALEFGIVRVRTSLWANKRKMYHKHGVKAVFQSSNEAPRNSLRVMHEHFHPITMLNS